MLIRKAETDLSCIQLTYYLIFFFFLSYSIIHVPIRDNTFMGRRNCVIAYSWNLYCSKPKEW